MRGLGNILNDSVDSLFIDARAVATLAIRELKRCKERESTYVQKIVVDSLYISDIKGKETDIVTWRNMLVAAVSIGVYSVIQLFFGGD